MNLDDLTEELESRALASHLASHLATHPAVAVRRLASVRDRIRARRRRQAAAATLAVAGGVAAVLIGSNLGVLRADRAPTPAGPHVVRAYTYDAVLAGDPLTASAVGRPGQADVTLRFTPTDTDLSLAPFCHVDGKSTALRAKASINGHSFTDLDCDDSTDANGSLVTPSDPDVVQERVAVRAGWAAKGAVPGRESVIRIRLTTAKGASATDGSVRLGVGLYALTGERITSDGVVIKKDAEIDGHDYRLGGYVTAPVTRTVREVRLAVPAGRWPVSATAGTLDPADKDSAKETILSGGGGDGISSIAGGGTVSPLLEDARAHTLRVRTASSTGVLMLAYYVRVD